MKKQAWFGLGLGVAAMLAGGAGVAFGGPGPGRGEGPAMGVAGGGPGMMGVPHPRMLERMARELQLTEDQKQKLKGVFESARPEMEQVRELSRQNAEKLRAAKPGDRNYDTVVSEVARNAGELATRAVTNGAQLRGQVWAVLTPEQRQKMETLQAQRREARKARMEQRRERMRGAQ